MDKWKCDFCGKGPCYLESKEIVPMCCIEDGVFSDWKEVASSVEIKIAWKCDNCSYGSCYFGQNDNIEPDSCVENDDRIEWKKVDSEG